MIETKVPMEIRSYKAKLIGPFTTRQLVCGAIAAAIDAILCFSVIIPFGINIKTAIVGLIVIDLPIMAFTLEPQGITLEKYLRHVLFHSFMAPTKRKAISQLPMKRDPVYTKKEIKQSQKKIKKLIKKHPEYKAYQ